MRLFPILLSSQRFEPQSEITGTSNNILGVKNLMTRLINWKSAVAVLVAQLFFALDPIITYACNGGTHGGC